MAQIDKVHTNSALENITMNHKIIAKTHIMLNKHHECSFSFVNALIIQEIQANTSTIHRITSIKLQYTLGAHIVIIQHNMRINASEAINHTGHFFLSVGASELLVGAV
jgi:hypothetical protein